MCEINSHGNSIVLKRILDLCIENGAILAEPGEFTKRAFLNGRMDLSQAEAVIDVINSKLKDTQELSSIKLSIDKNNLSSKMDVWLKDNSAAVKEYGSKDGLRPSGYAMP